MSEAFQATASRALQSNNELFMNVAQQKLGTTLEAAKGEFRERHEQFQALVKPLSQSYERLNPNIERPDPAESSPCHGNRQAFQCLD